LQEHLNLSLETAAMAQVMSQRGTSMLWLTTSIQYGPSSPHPRYFYAIFTDAEEIGWSKTF